jgi:hypothetical protein
MLWSACRAQGFAKGRFQASCIKGIATGRTKFFHLPVQDLITNATTLLEALPYIQKFSGAGSAR